MKTMQLTRHSMMLYFMLMTSSLFVILCKADGTLPCPSPCECYEENYIPYGDVNTIVCTNRELTAIPDLTSLKGSSILNNLELDQNKIEKISKSDFPPGLNIVVLDLSQNLGVEISYDAFFNLGYSLKKLSLDAVDMTYDKPLIMFDSLFSLQLLTLNNNNKHPYTVGAVQHVSISLFQGEMVKNLKRLELAFCGIRTMSEKALENLKSLEELNLSNNWFVAVPPAISPLKNLKFIELFYCNIKSLKKDDFAGLGKLEKIDLSSNSKLTTIAVNSFSGCENSLQKLNLQRCSLGTIPTKAIQTLKQLSLLDISENKFTNAGSGPLSGEYKLKELVISSPNLNFDPDIFKGQESNIVDLSIPRMNLKIIPLASIKKLTSLVRLSLGYNNITSLPENAFSGITAKSIRLHNNPLSYIAPGAFNGLPPNLDISLRRTKMADIDFLLDYPESAINSVNIEYSSLQCRCSMKSAINVTQTMQLYGSCAKGNKSVHISSNKLEAILDEACEEERRGNSGRNLVHVSIVWIVSLLCIIVVS